jgi:glycosyltransferase involved in cell wall biosynthesis
MLYKNPDEPHLHVCIFSPLKNAYSETFIKNHILLLPFHKYILNGTELSNLSYEEGPLLPPTLFNRVRRKVIFQISNEKDYLEKRRLRGFLKKHKIQVVLAEYGHIGALIYEACAGLDIPLVVHFHGNDASHGPTLQLLQKEYSKMFAYAFSIISVSRAMTERLRNIGAPADKIIYNCYGVDTSLFHESDEKWEVPTFIAVGRFVEKKAAHLTIMAFARAKEKFPRIRLVMVGDGPLLEVCKQLAKALQIEESVEFAGIKPPEEISSFVSRSLAFVQHSVVAGDGSAEGTPLAILEAGACGVPVISTRHEGIKDVVVENETGILVDEFDVEGMAEAMKHLAADPSLAREMGKKARSHINRNYSLSRHIEELTKIIIRSHQGSHEQD